MFEQQTQTQPQNISGKFMLQLPEKPQYDALGALSNKFVFCSGMRATIEIEMMSLADIRPKRHGRQRCCSIVAIAAVSTINATARRTLCSERQTCSDTSAVEHDMLYCSSKKTLEKRFVEKGVCAHTVAVLLRSGSLSESS